MDGVAFEHSLTIPGDHIDTYRSAPRTIDGSPENAATDAMNARSVLPAIAIILALSSGMNAQLTCPVPWEMNRVVSYSGPGCSGHSFYGTPTTPCRVGDPVTFSHALLRCEGVLGWEVDGQPVTNITVNSSYTSTTASFSTPGHHSALVRVKNPNVPDAIARSVGVPIVHSIEVADPRRFSEAAGAATIVIERTQLAGPASVNYETHDGSLQAGVSYTAVSGTVSFADGEWRKSVSVPLIDDAVYRVGYFQFRLSNPSAGYSLRTGGSTPITIDDDDPIPEVTVNFSAAEYVLNENDRVAVAVVTLTRNSNVELSMPFNAVVKADLELIGVSYSSAGFRPEETTGSLEVTMGTDRCYLRDETVVNLAVQSAAPYVLANHATAVLRIRDAQPVPTLTIDDVSVPEGDYFDRELQNVHLSAPLCYGLTVNVALQDVTTDRDDYDADDRPFQSYAFEYPGFMSSFSIRADRQIEPDETFRVRVLGFNSNPRQGDPVLARSTATVTILNDDHPPSMVGGSPSTTSVAPGATGAFRIAFSVPVTGVDVSDFELIETDVTGSSIASVDVVWWGAAGATPAFRTLYEVTVRFGRATQPAGGTVRLRLRDDDSIVGESGVPLGGTGIGNGTSLAAAEFALASEHDVPLTTTTLLVLAVALAAAAVIQTRGA